MSVGEPLSGFTVRSGNRGESDFTMWVWVLSTPNNSARLNLRLPSRPTLRSSRDLQECQAKLSEPVSSPLIIQNATSSMQWVIGVTACSSSFQSTQERQVCLTSVRKNTEDLNYLCWHFCCGWVSCRSLQRAEQSSIFQHLCTSFLSSREKRWRVNPSKRLRLFS